MLGWSAIVMVTLGVVGPGRGNPPQVGRDVRHDTSRPIRNLAAPQPQGSIEQRFMGRRAAAPILESFDGLGVGFDGPVGAPLLRNPSDNSVAVGPDHIVQTVNSVMAVFTRKGRLFQETGRALHGAVSTNSIFRGFGGACEQRNSGDAVVRYDQLARRWLFVLPIFSRPPGEPNGPYSMCYAVSAGADPLGPYHRYEFKRPLFPDYPRPAIWPDGYYVPTSTGDDVIQKHACVVERDRMLRGEPAREQCVIIEGVNFLNNADIDGYALPPRGAPNVMMAAGGAQLKGDLDDDGIYVWQFHVDWKDTTRTKVTGPVKIPVAPYAYLCGGQLTNCVPQPGSERKLDSQGDKLMARLVYRNINGRESIVGLHSIATSAGGGGVRWYEFRIGPNRAVRLHQQGTYAPDDPSGSPSYRWMGSIGMDRAGNIAMGYSFGGTPHFAGQRVAGRRPQDPPGTLGTAETVLATGAAAQEATLRWEDYTQLSMDPDDCRFWYVGDYFKPGASSYSTRIGSWRMPGCVGRPGR
ncbi:MAG: hypothetical protein IPK85_05980 [Gemmatimonadetes bacterium]|nr:hypothetical protein [Gemmatimonadota bacterium]